MNGTDIAGLTFKLLNPGGCYEGFRERERGGARGDGGWGG